MGLALSRTSAACWLAATLSAPAAAIELPGIELGFDTETPEVAFDVPTSLACTDVTTPEFAAQSPGKRLIQIETPVSLLLYHGEADRVRDLVIEIDGGDELTVYDYAPRTALASELAEPIEVRRTRSTDKTLGASLGGKLAGDVALTPTVSGGRSASDTATVTRRELPPKQAVVVSGTIGARSGVFYKLRSTTQSTLEGEQSFRVTFVAPADWSGGSVEVRCVARGEKKWLFVEQRRVWNELSRPVELKLVSHTVAKPAVEGVDLAPGESPGAK